MTPLYERSIDSPLGRLQLLASDDELVGVYFPRQRPVPPQRALEPDRHPVLDRTALELDEYFSGARRHFSLRVAPGGTDFQRAVWTELGRIPFGETRSYSQVARALGRAQAVRAVGTAVGRNPVSILVPCHRVVGANGALTGFSGGLTAKRWLLAHERGL